MEIEKLLLAEKTLSRFLAGFFLPAGVLTCWNT